MAAEVGGDVLQSQSVESESFRILEDHSFAWITQPAVTAGPHLDLMRTGHVSSSKIHATSRVYAYRLVLPSQH